MYLSKYLNIHLFNYASIYLFRFGPNNPPYFAGRTRERKSILSGAADFDYGIKCAVLKKTMQMQIG